MKNIIILNASRENGNTDRLVKAFQEGTVDCNIDEFRLNNMNIYGCTGCDWCKYNSSGDNPCIQDDEMLEIYESFERADVVVFASPIYFWTIAGPLKTVTDRLYAMLSKRGYANFKKESVLIMTAGSTDYSQAQRWYRTFETNLGWISKGEILGSNKIGQAKELGKRIK